MYISLRGRATINRRWVPRCESNQSNQTKNTRPCHGPCARCHVPRRQISTGFQIKRTPPSNPARRPSTTKNVRYKQEAKKKKTWKKTRRAEGRSPPSSSAPVVEAPGDERRDGSGPRDRARCMARCVHGGVWCVGHGAGVVGGCPAALELLLVAGSSRPRRAAQPQGGPAKPYIKPYIYSSAGLPCPSCPSFIRASFGP